MKGLFITYDIDPHYGGGIISKRNFDVVSKAFCLDVFICSRMKMNKFQILVNSLSFYDHGLTKKIEKEILKCIKNTNYSFIFLDSSLYGILLKKIKAIFPSIKIITFFHNVELLFSIKRIKSDGVQYLPLFFSALINELKSIKYSDFIITISDRDKQYIDKIYKRTADLIFPITIPDLFDNVIKQEPNKQIELVFIGSNFFANRVGISWFVKHIMPKIPDVNLTIIGRGFENCTYLIRDNVKVLGTVNDTKGYYHNANAIISPIFSGSGMKVKTAEALMMGKTIIGTKEAFIGYKKLNNTIYECDNKNSFLYSISLLKKNHFYNDDNRNYYLDSFSDVTNSTKIKILVDYMTNNESTV